MENLEKDGERETGEKSSSCSGLGTGPFLMCRRQHKMVQQEQEYNSFCAGEERVRKGVKRKKGSRKGGEAHRNTSSTLLPLHSLPASHQTHLQRRRLLCRRVDHLLSHNLLRSKLAHGLHDQLNIGEEVIKCYSRLRDRPSLESAASRREVSF
jgi:hypothetical protein